MRLEDILEPVCPDCNRAEMELDEDFPDHVVWRCPACIHRCTPTTYEKEWNELREKTILIGNDKKPVNLRLITYLSFGLIIAAVWYFFALFT